MASMNQYGKEHYGTLKAARLEMLTEAGRMLAAGDLVGAYTNLMNFKATLLDGSGPKLDLLAREQVIIEWKESGEQKARAITGTLERQDFEHITKPKIATEAVSKLHADCWAVALQYGMIPSE